jgi:hypothetical protein
MIADNRGAQRALGRWRRPGVPGYEIGHGRRSGRHLLILAEVSVRAPIADLVETVDRRSGPFAGTQEVPVRESSGPLDYRDSGPVTWD